MYSGGSSDQLSSNSDLFVLIDKYLKSSNNHLLLQACLSYLQTENLTDFSSVCNIKSVSSVASDKSFAEAVNPSSLYLIKSPADESSNPTLVQRAYKIVITIDYSCQFSNIEWIRRSLEKTFEKIVQEYDKFTQNSLNIEPHINLTVLIWDPLFRYGHQSSTDLPFVVLVYSKQLTKSDLDDMVNKIIAKLGQAKNLMNDSTRAFEFENQSGVGPTSSSSSLKSNSFEWLVSFVIKLFSVHSNSWSKLSSTQVSYLAGQHHIYITEGIFYTTDLIKTLDKIGKSAISFSFICTGSNGQYGCDISSSFGYLADHFLMKFIADISNGFYGLIDDNLQFQLIHPKSLFYSVPINLDELNASEPKPEKKFNKNKNAESTGLYGDSYFRRTHEYELSNRMQNTLFHLIRLRIQDGFYLIHMNKYRSSSSPSKERYHELVFKKHFTPTIFFLYKVRFNSNSMNKYNIEVWVSCKFLNFKSKYQNGFLREQIRQFLLQLERLDHDRTFELNNLMINPPEILRLKEPVFKILVSNSIMSTAKGSIGVGEELTLACSQIFSMQNMNFILNIRSSMETGFMNFAGAWFNLAFFCYAKNVLNKFFNSTSIKLLMEYDKPMPDLFDTKNPFYHSTSNSVNTDGKFKCQRSLNKLYTVLLDWCDVMLVENCVYLKLVEPAESAASRSKANSNTGNNSGNSASVSPSSKKNEDGLDSDSVENSNLLETKDMDSKSQQSKFSSIGQSSKQSLKLGTYFIIRIDTQYIPYVFVQFYFHSSMSYSDCLAAMNLFEEKIKQLNLQSMAANLIINTPTSDNKQSSNNKDKDDSNEILSNPLNLHSNHITTPATTPTGGNSTTNMMAYNNSNGNAMVMMALSSFQEPNECCYLLKKPDLFEVMRMWVFDESNGLNKNAEPAVASSKDNKENIPNTSKINNLLVNSLQCKKFEWTINKKLSISAAQRAKETIIDTFVRTRLKEGFKCVFQSSDFLTLALQVDMSDTETPPTTSSEPKSKKTKYPAPQTTTLFYVIFFDNNDSNVTDKLNYYSRNRQMSLPVSHRSQLGGKDDEFSNSMHENRKTSLPDTVHFRTELYYEAIEGVSINYHPGLLNLSKNNTKRAQRYNTYYRKYVKKSTSHYMKLTNSQIVDLIYLMDLKAFIALQSISTVFSHTSDFLNYMSMFRHFSNSDFQGLLTSNTNLSADTDVFDLIKLLPDLGILFRNHSLSKPSKLELSKSSSAANLQHRIEIGGKFIKHKVAKPEASSEMANKEEKSSKSSKPLNLKDKLRPILNCIDISLNSGSIQPPLSANQMLVNFELSLHSILFESSVYLCSFEDIPTNLFANDQNSQEAKFLKHTQDLFFKNIDEELKKLDDLSIFLKEQQAKESPNQDKNHVMDNIRREIQNALICKLSELKTGDSMPKRIVEHLRSDLDENKEDASKDFKFYISLGQTHIKSRASNMFNHSPSSVSPNHQPKYYSKNQYQPVQQSQQNDLDGNNLFVFGMFFLNKSNQVCHDSSKSCHNNKLIMFLFNATQDLIKSSLVESTQRNVCFIRKPLLGPKKQSFHSTSKQERDDKEESEESTGRGKRKARRAEMNDKAEYWLYKSGSGFNDLKIKLSSKDLSSYKNLIKNTLSISEILKYHLEMHSNDTFLLNCFDILEEASARVYIKCIIHYIAQYSYNRTIEKSAEENNCHEIESFEISSIYQLLKLGKKMKLTDIDLTDYFKLGCNHLKIANDPGTSEGQTQPGDWENKCSKANFDDVKYQYLEKKFEEIFLKRIDSLPGVNDLFVLSSRGIEAKTEDVVTGTDVLTDTDHDMITLPPLLMNPEDNHENLQESDNYFKSNGESDENDSDFDEFLTQRQSQASVARSLTAESYQSKSQMMTPSKQSSTNTQRSSYDVIKTHRDDELIVNYNDQIIGIEYVCVVDSAPRYQDAQEDSKANQDMTSYDALNEQSVVSSEITSATTELNKYSHYHQHAQKFKKMHFVSKIDKFRFSCILDLIVTSCSSELYKEFLSQMGSSNRSSPASIRVYLRFNWYSFYDLDMSSHFHLNSHSNSKHFQPMNHTASTGMYHLTDLQPNPANNKINTVGSTSNINNAHTFQYNNLLLPKIEEFNWHLRDELYQFELVKFNSLNEFTFYKNHIKQGVVNHYNSFNFKEVIKVLLNKQWITTTLSAFDPQPKTNASKLPSNLKTTKISRVEEDKRVLNVDPAKFLIEFKSAFARLSNQFFKCKLEQLDDTSYYLICRYVRGQDTGSLDSHKDLCFKILIKVQISRRKKRVDANNPPQSSKHGRHGMASSTSPTVEQSIIENQPSVKMGISAFRKNYIQTVTDSQPIKPKTFNTTEEIALSTFTIKAYFAFSHFISKFDQNDIDFIIGEFKKEMDVVVNLTFLAVVLKDINEHKKWNNMMRLEYIKPETDGNDERNQHSETKPILETKPNKLYSVTSLSCPRVWSVYFKLHRLHQSMQKDALSKFVSLGLKKLREPLVNYKMDDTTQDDSYIFRYGGEIYILTLEEIYDTSSSTSGAGGNQTSNSASTQNVFNDDTILTSSIGSNYNNSGGNLTDDLGLSMKGNTKGPGSMLSRRPSHVNISETSDDRTSMSGGGPLPPTKSLIRQQHFSGDNTNVAGNMSASAPAPLYRSSPDYIRLDVFGLQQPCDDMKQYLCKLLQAELDNWLLIKMCNSIDKNTYKTTSAQHPDKITDEDLQFFKQICENYFDYEIPLPFVFNFNRTLRENFFYFVKQIFGFNFKSIDPSMPGYLNSTLVTDGLSSTKEKDRDLDEVHNILIKEEKQLELSNFKTLYSNFHEQGAAKQNERLYTSANPNNLKRNDSDFNNCLLLTRIFFHNSKTVLIGKHGVCLVLVEAYYSVRGLKNYGSNKLMRSNSIGSNTKPASTNLAAGQSSGPNCKNQSQGLDSHPMVENGYRKSGPAFIFRFYCRGENDITMYKASLKSALNDALSCFFSDYLTRIDPELYLKRVKLSRAPALFRFTESSGELDDRVKSHRKRHKSTGNDKSAIGDINDLNNPFSLKMNKSAHHTKLGRMLLAEKITQESQLNSFIVSNFNSNLFDFRDYEDTIEYFREPIKIFNCNQILNNIITQSSNYYVKSTVPTECSKTPDTADPFHTSLEISGNHNDSITSSSDTNSVSSHSSKNTNDSQTNKTYLRLVYDWLRHLYDSQTKNSASYRLSSSFYQSPTPGQSVTGSGVTNSSHSLILCRKVSYYTKFNLTNLLRDLETGLKDICKCDIGSAYFSFKNESKSFTVLNNTFKNEPDHDTSTESHVLEADMFDLEFDNLKFTEFNMIQDNLSRLENLVITMNAEYSSPNQLLASMSSSINSSTLPGSNTTPTYTRVPSFSGQDLTFKSSLANSSNANTVLTASATSSSSSNNSHSTLTNQNIMSKSVCSISGIDLESSLSLSLSLNNLQLKRTYCYLIVDARSKSLTMFAFTTENGHYDAIKQLLDQSIDSIKKRYHIVNNTVLYKYGGLIGDNLIYDFKKAKHLTLSACQSGSGLPQNSLADSSLTATPNQESTIITEAKKNLTALSKSPTAIQRQLSQGPNKTKPYINPSAIASLQFTSSPTSNSQTNTTGSISAPSSSTSQPTINTIFPINKLLISQYNNKQYDMTFHLINQQIVFFTNYVTSQLIGTDYSQASQPKSVFAGSYLLPIVTLNSSSQQVIKYTSSLFGVGMYYQLSEMQQLYRHARKVYEFATCVAPPAPTQAQSTTPMTGSKIGELKQPLSTTKSVQLQTQSSTGAIQTQRSQQQSINDFIEPILIPVHYCATPLLFFPSWNEAMVTEEQLKPENKDRRASSISNFKGLSSSSWYFKMRQAVFSEYSSYFEQRGFTRLRDEKSSENLSKQGKLSGHQPQNETLPVHHFIKWVQQDGFLYMTMSLDSIYLVVKLGYCLRYRSANKSLFMNEITHFQLRDFHVHSYTYDYHLSAINTSILSGEVIAQTSELIADFLNKFVDFYATRAPVFSYNTVIRTIYERADNSLIAHQFGLIFDYVIESRLRLNDMLETKSNIKIKTLCLFDNNIAIYRLEEPDKKSEHFYKYLVIKIESYTKEVAVSVKETAIAKSSNTSTARSTSTKKIESSTVTSKDLNKMRSNSSSTASLYMLNKATSTPTNSITPIPSVSALSPPAATQSFIQVKFYYVYINKSEKVGEKSAKKFDQDLNYIYRIIDESISLYKQNLFWANLKTSNESMYNFDSNDMSTSNMMPLVINVEELEQVLSCSYIIDILDLDPSLAYFLSQCYSIRSKIHEHLKQLLGRYLISTESNMIEYHMLLINDDLIEKFKIKGMIGSSRREFNRDINSFILVKFDQSNMSTQVLQVNKSASRDTIKKASDNSTNGNERHSSELDSTKPDIVNRVYLNFAMNLVIYAFWENIYVSKDK